MLILVVLLLGFSLYTATATHRASASNNSSAAGCRCLSVASAIGGTAVKYAALVAASFGLAVLACCGPRLLPRQLAVLSDGMVPEIIFPGMYTTYFGLELCSAIVCHFSGVWFTTFVGDQLFLFCCPHPMFLSDTA